MKKEVFGREFLILFALLIGVLPNVLAAGAARRTRTADPGVGGTAQEDPRRQALQQQAQEAAGFLEKALDDFFGQINEYKDPGEIYVKSASVLLEESRRHMGMFEDPAKARYMLLQGWVDYSTGDVESALASSARACRMDASNRDAWVSQQYFSLLLSKRPIQPRPPRSAMPRGLLGAAGEMTPELNTRQVLYGTSGKLDFNPETLRHDLLGKTLKPFSGSFLDGTPLNYQPNENGPVLCLLIWEVPLERLTEERPVPTDQPLLYTPSRQPLPAGAAEGTAESSADGSPAVLPAQLKVLEQLKEQAARAGKKEIVFLSVLTNKPDQKPAVERYLAENPHPLPVLYAAGNTTDLVLEAKTPFAALVDKSGQFRFAGSAEGFMLPMLLRHLSGVVFQKPASQISAGLEGGYLPTRAVTDPNRPALPAADPNLRTPAGPGFGAVSAQKESDEMYEEVCGADQLAAAQDFFLKAAGKQLVSYRKGVDLCRYVIRNCPHSKNAEAARELLRTKVPEDQRETLGLTREELGL